MKNTKLLLLGNLFSLIPLLCATLCCNGYTKSSTSLVNKKEKKPAMYSMEYADYQHTSYQDLTTGFRGKEIWFADLKGYMPSLLITTESGLIVQCSSLFGKISYSGKLQWDKGHDNGLMIFFQSGQIFYRFGASLNSVDVNCKRILKNQDIYSSYSDGWIEFALPMDDGGVVAQTFYQPMNDDPDKPDRPNEYTLIRMKPQEESDWFWIKSFENAIWPALLSHDKNTLVVSNHTGTVTYIEIASGTPIFDFTIPNSQYFCGMCIDFTNNLITAYFDKNDSFNVSSITAKGVINWTYKSDSSFEMSSFSQFAVNKTGSVFCVIGNSLLCVKNGTLEWEETLLSGNTPRYITALADGKVLAASGHFLICYDSNGKTISEAVLTDSIYTPPVVDMKGRVYVGVEKGIFCFE